MSEERDGRNQSPRAKDRAAQGQGIKGWLAARLVTLSWLYGTGLLVLLGLRFIYGDRSWWAFAFNSLALYWFAPLPLLLPFALWVRRRDVWAVFGFGLAAWAVLFGGLFLPRLPAAQASGPALTVAAYNVLGFNQDAASVIDVLRAVDADVVGLQELNPAVAAALERELAGVYPHRLLDPRPGVNGAGVLSKYPLRDAGQAIAHPVWVSEPHVLSLDVDGRVVTFVRFHAVPGIANAGARDQQARFLADFARAQAGPLIVVGDLNATDQNTAYATIARELTDAWRAAGWGFGHTFPGEPTAAVGGSRPVVMGVPVPKWLLRIDFVFYSDEFTALAARLGPDSGRSDHRPVVATLVLK